MAQAPSCLRSFIHLPAPRIGSYVVAFVLISGLSACSNTVRQDHDFALGVRDVRTIAILPPEAEFVRVTLSDNTRDAESESLVQKKLAEVTPKLLAEKGYAVTTELIQIAGTAGVPLNLHFEKIKLELANATRKLYEQDASDVEAHNLKINLGASARAMAAAANADALMLVAYSEKKPSVGVVVASVAVGVALGVITNGNLPRGGSKPCKVQSTLIDGRTGDVLWLNVQATSECRNYLKAMGDALEWLPHAHYR